MFDPLVHVTALLGVLPVIGLLSFLMKCYISVNFRRVWDIDDIYKLFPTNMILFTFEVFFHEVPELVLIYFYQTRYKPASFDLRMTALIQPAIDFLLALLNIATTAFAIYQYQSKVFFRRDSNFRKVSSGFLIFHFRCFF